MQIPSQLHPFTKRTLIVVTNALKAKLFLANDQNVEKIAVVDVTSDLEQETGEREAIKAGGAGSPIFRSNDEYGTKKEHITKDHFYHALNEDLLHRLQKNEFEALIFTVPEELENELKEYLHGQLLKKTKKFVPKNLMNGGLLGVVAVVQEMPEE